MSNEVRLEPVTPELLVAEECAACSPSAYPMNCERRSPGLKESLVVISG